MTDVLAAGSDVLMGGKLGAEGVRKRGHPDLLQGTLHGECPDAPEKRQDLRHDELHGESLGRAQKHKTCSMTRSPVKAQPGPKSVQTCCLESVGPKVESIWWTLGRLPDACQEALNEVPGLPCPGSAAQWTSGAPA